MTPRDKTTVPINPSLLPSSRPPATPFSRRQLLQRAGAGLAALAVIPACGGSPDPGATDDAAPGDSPDMAGPAADMAVGDLTSSGPACTPSTFDTGMPPSAFKVDTATLLRAKHTFVCRDAQGLYAMTSVCTHEGCTPSFVDANSGFQCPCHGATFDFNGENPAGPARRPLDHYPLCVGPNGHVAVDNTRTVVATARVVA